MSLVAHQFGRVEFPISNICYCFLQAIAVEKSKQIFEIRHVQMDELPSPIKNLFDFMNWLDKICIQLTVLKKWGHATLGTFLLVGSADHGKMFLCDTKTSSNLKLAPPPMGAQRARKPTKFKPSFDSPGNKSDGKEEVSEADEETTEELQG